tara:strand:- start:367 stop:582 length:216 start_codon:yes stop_codon:yes gene_type:complete
MSKQIDSKETESKPESYTVLPTVLDEMIEYMESAEESFDSEWGSGRDIKELIILGKMPDLYNKLLSIRYGR